MFDALGSLVFNAAFYVIYYPLLGLSLLFPQSILGINTNALTNTWASTMAGWMNTFNAIVPVHWFLTLIYGYLLFEVGISTFNLIRFVWNFLRGSGA